MKLTKVHYIIGGIVIIGASVGGYLWYKNSKKIVEPQLTIDANDYIYKVGMGTATSAVPSEVAEKAREIVSATPANYNVAQKAI